MPRYFFHTIDGSCDRDTVGTELPDLAAARIAGIRYAGDVISDTPDVLRNGDDFRVEVTDGRDLLLFTIITMAVSAPAAGEGMTNNAAPAI